jgi:hypothetical protein
MEAAGEMSVVGLSPDTTFLGSFLSLFTEVLRDGLGF